MANIFFNTAVSQKPFECSLNSTAIAWGNWFLKPLRYVSDGYTVTIKEKECKFLKEFTPDSNEGCLKKYLRIAAIIISIVPGIIIGSIIKTIGFISSSVRKQHRLMVMEFAAISLRTSSSPSEAPDFQKNLSLIPAISDDTPEADLVNKVAPNPVIPTIKIETPASEPPTTSLSSDKTIITNSKSLATPSFSTKYILTVSPYITEPKRLIKFNEVQSLLSKMEGFDIKYDEENLCFIFGNGKQEILAYLYNQVNMPELRNLFMVRDRNVFNGYFIFEGLSVINTLAFEEQNKRLIEAAESYFKEYSGKERDADSIDWTSQLSTLEADTTADNIFKTVLGKSGVPGICIGEAHQDPAPKKVLIDHMHTLKESGVTTLFLEHLFYDTSFQREMDKWSKMHGEMPPIIKHRLKHMDEGFHSNKDYNFTELVKAAINAGIRVVGIDTNASYACGFSDRDGVTNTRERMLGMNFVAQDIIQREKGSGKFIALMGNMHATTSVGIPGVPELVRAPSLLVSSLEPGKLGVIKKYRETVKEHVLAFDLALHLRC